MVMWKMVCFVFSEGRRAGSTLLCGRGDGGVLGRGLHLSAWLEVCLDICRRIQAAESCSAAYEFCEINASYLLYYNDSAYHAATQINHCLLCST